MKREHYIYGLLIVLASVLIGCSKYDAIPPGYPNDGWSDFGGTPRLVVKGTVTNTADEPLQGMYVAIYGVREEGEPDVLSYNYARTDSVGRYTIVRYRGREIPAEVTVVATDSAGIYQEQIRFATVSSDSIDTRTGKQPYNAFVTADFVLELY